MAKPGCQGRIEESYIKYITPEQLQKIHAYMIQVEDEYLGNVEEEEEEGEEEDTEEELEFLKLLGDMDIPDFTLQFDTEEELGEDDGPHITVDQVHTTDSADEGQGGAEGEPPEEAAGHVDAASDDHKSSDRSTREEL